MATDFFSPLAPVELNFLVSRDPIAGETIYWTECGTQPMGAIDLGTDGLAGPFHTYNAGTKILTVKFQTTFACDSWTSGCQLSIGGAFNRVVTVPTFKTVCGVYLAGTVPATTPVPITIALDFHRIDPNSAATTSIGLVCDDGSTTVTLNGPAPYTTATDGFSVLYSTRVGVELCSVQFFPPTTGFDAFKAGSKPNTYSQLTIEFTNSGATFATTGTLTYTSTTPATVGAGERFDLQWTTDIATDVDGPYMWWSSECGEQLYTAASPFLAKNVAAGGTITLPLKASNVCGFTWTGCALHVATRKAFTGLDDVPVGIGQTEWVEHATTKWTTFPATTCGQTRFIVHPAYNTPSFQYVASGAPMYFAFELWAEPDADGPIVAWSSQCGTSNTDMGTFNLNDADVQSNLKWSQSSMSFQFGFVPAEACDVTLPIACTLEVTGGSWAGTVALPHLTTACGAYVVQSVPSATVVDVINRIFVYAVSTVTTQEVSLACTSGFTGAPQSLSPEYVRFDHTVSRYTGYGQVDACTVTIVNPGSFRVLQQNAHSNGFTIMPNGPTFKITVEDGTVAQHESAHHAWTPSVGGTRTDHRRPAHRIALHDRVRSHAHPLPSLFAHSYMSRPSASVCSFCCVC
jgi:hypothetical protein